ncbi:LysR substrate-binding domain-containing protein [Candidatus Solirubrobacter pratensis]|uniref:LysR substrate-binding domain-containing protein n=1 Tax=Candidatus Solirubrobacter pratensis TaxID=1298857 RepID=UPI0009DC018E|nr:LysR substrate-binding domain-containing protein [Candidatus Solirubrobacter pratensis]
MTDQHEASRVRIRYDACLPQARWGPLFHVFRLEQPDVLLDWRPDGFPTRDVPLLDGADVGLFLEPPLEPGLGALTLDVSPMVVIVGAGHRLAGQGELCVADVLGEPFPGGPRLHPGWNAFWTLDEHRGGPPVSTDDDVRTVAHGLEVIAQGRAIGTIAASVVHGLDHPGVVALPLRDGPMVTTRLVWRAADDNPLVRALVELAGAWTRTDRPLSDER